MESLKPIIPMKEENLFDELGSRWRGIFAAYMAIVPTIIDFYGHECPMRSTPDNHIEISVDEFSLVADMSSGWAEDFARAQDNVKYMGVLNVKSGHYHVFDIGNGKMITVTPVQKLVGISFQYYLKIRHLDRKLVGKIVAKQKKKRIER